MNRWLSHLNPEQQQAAAHNYGPLLILAGAGSGKTTVLVSRTGRLIDEGLTTPERVCVLTFTNKAAHELKTRVSSKLGKPAKKVWSGTFHGFGLQFLKEHWKEAGLPKKFGIIDGTDGMAILKDIMRDHTAYEKERFAMERLMEKISFLRQGGKESGLDETIESAMSIVIAPKFITKMRHLGVVDFEDLLLRPLQMMKENPSLKDKLQSRFDFVMVDEFQDTNSIQMRLIDELTATHRNIAVVGDDDQSIYGWRGAEIKNILNFPRRYENCLTIRLERNYRSSATIIDLANSVISNNKDRHSKVLRPGLEQAGETPELFVYENENIEVDQVVSEIESAFKNGYQWRDIAVLYRSNSQGGMIEGGLRRARVPYKLTGGTALFDRKEAKDALAFIRSSLFPSEVSFRRIINLPARGVGEKTIEEIEAIDLNLEFHKKAKLWAKRNPDEKAALAIENLFQFLEQLKTNLVMSHDDAETVLTQELSRLGYRHYVTQNYRDPNIAEKRWTSVLILGRILQSMFAKNGRTIGTLEKFIDAMELRDPVEHQDEGANEVQMMTLHACKGLEFPLVFLLGLEEDLLPHARLGQDVDEERRLFYVGVTRAKKHLILTRVKQRKRYGRMQPVAPSRFLLEVDPKLYIEHDEVRPVTEEQREVLVSDFLKQLNEKIAARNSEN